MFTAGTFTSHSGLSLPFKIDCDSLTGDDWSAIAGVVAKLVDFREVVGIPRGGLQFAEALRPYANPESDVTLIVDDVCTSGASLEKARAGRDASGVVLFARGPTPSWVKSIFTLNESLWHVPRQSEVI